MTAIILLCIHPKLMIAEMSAIQEGNEEERMHLQQG